MNNLTTTTQITKKVILEELMKIKIDHSIQISEKELDAKVNLLFEDCKEITSERFKGNSAFLRKKELFGKFPPNHEFICPKTEPKLNSYAKPSYLDYLTGGK